MTETYDKNRCEIEGTVIWAGGSDKVFKGKIETNDGKFKNIVPFTAFGQLKDALKQHMVTAGARISIVGKVSLSSYKNNRTGEYVNDCSVIVDSYDVIAHAPVGESEKAASAPQGDAYDPDIPF